MQHSQLQFSGHYGNRQSFRAKEGPAEFNGAARCTRYSFTRPQCIARFLCVFISRVTFSLRFRCISRTFFTVPSLALHAAAPKVVVKRTGSRNPASLSSGHYYRGGKVRYDCPHVVHVEPTAIVEGPRDRGAPRYNDSTRRRSGSNLSLDHSIMFLLHIMNAHWRSPMRSLSTSCVFYC